MAVYVDSPVVYPAEPTGYVGHARDRAAWCHMIADTEPELHQMAQRIGLRQEWYQGDHYDLVPSKRRLAIGYGAIAVNREQFVAIRRRKRGEQHHG